MTADEQSAAAGSPEPAPPPRLLTISEAAQWAGVSYATINKWVQDGRLPSTRIGYRHYIRPADLVRTSATEHLGGVVPAWRQNPTHAGQRLRTFREAAGLSQLALAAASGLTHEQISRLESGRQAPYVSTVLALAKALGVAPERFVDDVPMGLTTLTTAEAAARLGVPTGRVCKWLRQGELPGVKVSGEWRVLAVVIFELGRSGRLRGHSRRLDPRYRG
jgi:excisionase family DNA binding protein